MEDQKENQTTSGSSISNFFTSSSSTNNNNDSQPITSQAFPPSEYNPQPSYQLPQNYNQYNPQQNPQQPQQVPSTQKSFLEKVNSTATGVFDYIKNKAPVLPSNIIPKKLLDNVDPLTIISEIKMENFEKNILNKSKREVDCLKLEKTNLNDITILVNISNPHQINNSLFSTNYILYDVSTPQLKWIVNRRYSDFIWLRDCLKALFPGDMIPLLPKKKIGNRRFESDFIEKRKDGLQKFINEIINSEKYKTTEVLMIFLSCGERNIFEQKMKVINPKLLNRQNVYNIQSIDGKNKIININNNFEFQKEIFSHFESINTFTNCHNDLLQSLQKNLSGYKKSMIEACNYLEEVENNFSKLSMMMTKVNISDKFKNVYEQYEIFFKNWKRMQVNQCCIIKDTIKTFFKDVKNKFSSLIENLEKEQILSEEYQIFNNKLMAKKELLWQQMDVSKWELSPMDQIDTNRLYKDKIYAQDKMCFKESSDLGIKGELLGYYFYQSYINFKNIIEELDKKYVINIKEFANQIYPSLADGINIYSKLVSQSY